MRRTTNRRQSTPRGVSGCRNAAQVPLATKSLDYTYMENGGTQELGYDLGAWIDRCTRRFVALYPSSPLDGTDWDDIARDLWDENPNRTPEAAAEGWEGGLPLSEWRAPPE